MQIIGSAGHGRGSGNITAPERRKVGQAVGNQMPDVAAALHNGQVKVLFLPGSNFLNSFADAGDIEAGLAKTDLVISYDLFMNATARACGIWTTANGRRSRKPP